MINELKFTPENLQRHLDCMAYKQWGVIHTTRDSQKGRVGEIFYIRNVGFFVLDEVKEQNITDFVYEGFKTKEEFDAELDRIYGRHTGLYMLSFLKLRNLIEEAVEVDRGGAE